MSATADTPAGTSRRNVGAQPNARRRLRLRGLAVAAALGGLALGLTACVSGPVAAPPTVTSAPDDDGMRDDSVDETPGPEGATHTIVKDQDLIVSEEGPVTVHCDGGGEVTIVASSIDATFTGVCEEIEIDGSDNQVAFATVDNLDIDGSRNTVSGDHADDIDIEGDENQVTVVTTGEIEVEGNSNTVRFSSGQPEIEDEGSGNSIGS